mgnify:CR=1 FL=1
MHAPMQSSRDRTSTATGQYSSHLLYCSSSFFRQHRDGQLYGHAQQHIMNGDSVRISTRPTANGPTNIPNCVPLDWICVWAAVKLPDNTLPISAFLHHTKSTRPARACR